MESSLEKQKHNCILTMKKQIFVEDRLYILVAEGTAMVKKTDPNPFPHGNCCLVG